MPKKTRKEKIIAQLRRKLETVKDFPVEIIQEEKATPTNLMVNYQLPQLTKTPETKTILIEKNNLGLILRDLRKTFFLAGFAISFEFIVYWFTELGGSKLLKFLPLFK